MQLLGILLICYSSRGHQYVFGYPTNPCHRLINTLSSPVLPPINLINSMNYSENNFQVQSDSYISNYSETYESQKHTTTKQQQQQQQQQKQQHPQQQLNENRESDTMLKQRNNQEKIETNSKVEENTITRDLNKGLLPINGKPMDSNKKRGSHGHTMNSSGNKKGLNIGSSQTSKINENRTGHHNQTETFLGFDTQFLADILSPKSALCDQKFQLTINNLTFVGHPTMINADSVPTKTGILNRYLKSRNRHSSTTSTTTTSVNPTTSTTTTTTTTINTTITTTTTTTTTTNPSSSIPTNTNAALASTNSTGSGGTTTTTSSTFNKSGFSSHKVKSNSKNMLSIITTPNLTTPSQPPLTTTSITTTTTPSMNTTINNVSMTAPTTAVGTNIKGINDLGKSTGIMSNPPPNINIKNPNLLNKSSKDFSISSNSSFTLNSNMSGLVSPTSSSQFSSMDNSDSVYTDNSSTSNYSKKDTPNLSMFHVVFIIKPSDDKSFDAEIDKLYKNVILKLTHGLQHEQVYRSYVMKQTDLILSIKDEYYEDSNQMMDNILAHSSLARDLVTVYDSITTNNIAHIIINNSVDLTLQIPSTLPSPDDGNLITFDEQSLSHDASFPTLRPYHSLLLLQDPEEILKSLPRDPSPTLVALIQVVTPMQCFEELQSILDCSLSHIYKLAAHLVYWRKARIIDVISIRNVYVVSPNADLNSLPMLCKDFENHFPGIDLLSIFSELSIPRQFSTIIPSKEQYTLFLEIVTYFLRHNLVTQLHKYIYLSIPQEIKKRTMYSLSLSDNDEFSSSDNSSIIPNPSETSEIENEWIKMLASTKNPPESALFLRLVPYFTGKYHVEEIIFRENLTRKDLKIIMNIFRNELITVLHQ